MTCRAVTFPNRDGLRLFGIVHLPDSITPGQLPVILLSPGLKSRVAPHRLYVKLATHLAAMGHVVLRFDFAGLGDSEGLVKEATVADFYGTVQSGRYVDDTRAAMDWMQAEYGGSRFVLAGLCGGAITGLLAGASDLRVAGLIALGLPVLLDGQNVDHTRYLTTGEIDQWREGYVAKLVDLKSWLRLLTFRSNFRVIGRVLASMFRRKKAPAPVVPDALRTVVDNFNPLVPGAFEAMTSTRPVLIIFGGADRLHAIYEERFARRFGEMLEQHSRNIEVRVIAQSNHVFSLPEWEHAMLHHVRMWLRRHRAVIFETTTTANMPPTAAAG